LAASAGLLVLGVPVAALFRGGAWAGGVAAGVALVAVSYSVSSVIIAWVDSIDPKLIMMVGLATYVIKFTLIGVLMWVIASTGWSGLTAMGVAVMTTVLVWVIAQSWWTWKARILYVDA
jgi:ATP synthase protein I